MRENEVPANTPKLAFVFPGQGSQWMGMGQQLLAQEPVFYQTIQHISGLIEARFGWSLLDVLLAPSPNPSLDDIAVIQPALFAIQVALAEVWKSWGIVPDAVAGHSMGEVAAACVAGMITWEDAVQVICRRSRLMKTLRGKGSMLLTDLSPGEAEAVCKSYNNTIALAVINSPSATVLSGSPEVVQQVMFFLQSQQRFCKPVNVDVASHSAQMDVLQADLLRELTGLSSQPATIPFYSTVTGVRGDDLPLNADYWMNNLRQPVLFSGAVAQLLRDGHTMFIEISPHPILLGSIQQCLPAGNGITRLLPSLRREEKERTVMLSTLGVLYTQGFSIRWEQLYPHGKKWAPLPPIPWQRQRYWIEETATEIAGVKYFSVNTIHPLLGNRLSLANTPDTYVWQTYLTEDVMYYLKDHRVEGEILFPAAGFIEMALGAVEEANLQDTHGLSDLVFESKLILDGNKSPLLQTILSPENPNLFSIKIYSQSSPERAWKQHASLALIPKPAEWDETAACKTVPDEILQNNTGEQTAKALYETLAAGGISYGQNFRAVTRLWQKEYGAVGQIVLPNMLHQNSEAYVLHPVLLDGCLQVLAATMNATEKDVVYLPAGCRTFRLFAKPGNVLWSEVRRQPADQFATGTITADIRLTDDDGNLVAVLTGFRLQPIRRHIRPLHLVPETWLYEVQWQMNNLVQPATHYLPEKKHWLIITREADAGKDLATQLEATGNSCFLFLYQSTDSGNGRSPVSFFREKFEQFLFAN